MRSLPVHVWREFQLAVMLLSAESLLRDVLSVILSWGRSSYKCFAVDPFLSYGLDEFLHVNEKLMLVEYSSFLPGDIARLKKVIMEYQAKDVEFIARFLRDSVESLIAVEVNNQYPRCETDGGAFL